jgi:hypothetical protein
MQPALALVHQALLFTHLLAFAITLSAVLREDLRWLRQRRVEPAALRRTQRVVGPGLAVLWASGLALVALAAWASPGPWVPGAKLCAKLVVVSVLTLNGWALHAWVLPGLGGQRVQPADVGTLGLVLGSISGASWFVAAFIGAARPLAPLVSFGGFMALYALALAGAAAIAAASQRWPRLPARQGVGQH